MRIAEADTVSPGTGALALAAIPIASGGIRIQWLPLNLGPTAQIVIFRKPLSADAWTVPAVGEPAYNDTSFDDLTAQVGVAYEYKVTYYSELGAAAVSKYIFASNMAAPKTGSRGTLLLVIDESQLDGTRDTAGTTLESSLRQYQADLIGEGYRVRTLLVPRVEMPRSPPSDLSPAGIAAHYGPWSNAVTSLKAQIRTVWQTTPDLASVVLIGHVPVPYSGLVSPDGAAHLQALGAWPADVFYSTLSTPDSLWTDNIDVEGSSDANFNVAGDGKFDQDALTQLGLGTDFENQVFSDVPIGRIDFAMMDVFKGVGASAGSTASAAETQLLARYFEKSHAWRTGQVSVRRKAVFEEQFPFPEYYDTNRLAPNVGVNGVERGTVSPFEILTTGEIPAPTDYDLTEQSWLWMYAGAGGYPGRHVIHFNPNRELHVNHYANGAHATPGTRAAQFDEGPHRSVFNFVYGSYVGDWNSPDSLLRSVIAEPDGLGLAVAWGARPNWDQHHMGLGETIGLSLHKTQNNFGDRQAYDYSAYQANTRLSLLGDPTLRQDNVRPAMGVVAMPAPSGKSVSWAASADPAVAGYYVYRASSPAGPFTLLNSAATVGTTFADTSAPTVGETYYMVRAAKLETTQSGSYWNLSVGAFDTPYVTGARFLPAGKSWSIELSFNQDVGASLSSDSFAITGNRYDPTTRSSFPVTLTAGIDFRLQNYDPTTRTAIVLFKSESGLGSVVTLPSGRYSLSFAGAVTNGLNVAVNPSYAFAFGHLLGDANGDLRVDFADLVALAQHYNQNVGTNGPLSGDFNGDGVVNFDDLVTLAQNYNQAI